MNFANDGRPQLELDARLRDQVFGRTHFFENIFDTDELGIFFRRKFDVERDVIEQLRAKKLFENFGVRAVRIELHRETAPANFFSKSSASLFGVSALRRSRKPRRAVFLRQSRNAKNFSSGINSGNFSGKTSSGLWQKPQRKLHPGVKTVAAVRPGKSKSVNFCSAAICILEF